MSEQEKDPALEVLRNFSTDALLAELARRSLTAEEVSKLQLLRPAETTGTSQTTLATEGRTDVKSSAERFARAVVRKNVQGKLPEGSTINGVKINSRNVGGFYDHGPDQMRLSPDDHRINQLYSGIYHEQDQFPDLVGAHVVSVTPSEADHENTVLTIHFFQDRKQIDSRGSCTPAYVSAELPGGAMTEFLSEMLKNPDLLEDFYQRIFVGLDSQGDLPGMRRVKADGFFLISGTKLEEAVKIQGYDTQAVSTFFKSLEKHQYQKGPYGTGDAFQPR